jgi:hypothetical protein
MELSRCIPEYLRWEVVQEGADWLVVRNGDWHSDGPQGMEVFARFLNERHAIKAAAGLNG